jgi:hypothetical protein
MDGVYDYGHTGPRCGQPPNDSSLAAVRVHNIRPIRHKDFFKTMQRLPVLPRSNGSNQLRHNAQHPGLSGEERLQGAFRALGGS